MNKPFYHRYIPNSAPGVKDEMLREIGVENVDELFQEIPSDLRFTGELNIPQEPSSELEVARKIRELLSKNTTTTDLLSFLGAGCWSHFVPALCDEIIGRSEFVTSYIGESFTDLGRFQAIFEYQSMISALLEMEVVASPVYDGNTASGDALQMAFRATGRRELLLPKTTSPQRVSTLQNYAGSDYSIREIDYDRETGQLDLNDLESKLSDQTAAVFIENPSYLGFIETQCDEIADLAHSFDALLIAYINPISLGLLAPPGNYHADIACGEGQPLGAPLYCGGAAFGILACNDLQRLMPLMPAYIVGINDTLVDGEKGFSSATLHERLVYTARGQSQSYTGSAAWLWGISAAVYLSLMGPDGMRKIAELNMQKAYFAMELLSDIAGVKVPVFGSPHFNEFIVNFDDTGLTTKQINDALFDSGILGGKDLSIEFPDLGQSTLFCVTEVHERRDIERLVEELKVIVQSEGVRHGG